MSGHRELTVISSMILLAEDLEAQNVEDIYCLPDAEDPSMLTR